jgi:siroheme synthase-like protein
VRATSAHGSLVVDPFCGSGTTLVAAAGAGRRFAGGDAGELAVATWSAARRGGRDVPLRGMLPRMTRAALHPVFLDVSGRDVLVVGGGLVAERKVTELLDAGASVRVVAPEATQRLDELAATGNIALERRPFAEGDVDGSWLVVAATDRDAVQRGVAAACESARIFCIAVDDPTNASAYGGSVVRRGGVTIAISTSGEAPAVAKLMREVLEQALPEESWREAARELRDRWKREGTPMESRFAELVRAFKARAG